MPYAGKKSILLYIAMIMSAISGIMILMPMVFIHRIVNSLILNEIVDFAYVRENSIYAATFALICSSMFTSVGPTRLQITW